jgi:DNA-binding MarR family transcriptional regulator
MHIIFFGLKRAHHGTLHITRPMLIRMGLTAARFDLLYAVKERRNGIRQSVLRRVLGVSRATVSKMLASLEELGLLTRETDREDRRTRRVRLTSLGLHRIRYAYRQLARSGWAQLAVESALGPAGAEAATQVLDDLLSRIREAFGDFGSLEYPWPHPDDFVPWHVRLEEKLEALLEDLEG